MEFLGCVPLLQRLPSSSLKKIAQLVVSKQYGQFRSLIFCSSVKFNCNSTKKGLNFECNCVQIKESMLFVRVRLGLGFTSYGKERLVFSFGYWNWNLDYLVSLSLIEWFTQAEVTGSVNADEDNRPEFQLKRYDYFGYGENWEPFLWMQESGFLWCYVFGYDSLRMLCSFFYMFEKWVSWTIPGAIGIVLFEIV